MGYTITSGADGTSVEHTDGRYDIIKSVEHLQSRNGKIEVIVGGQVAVSFKASEVDDVDGDDPNDPTPLTDKQMIDLLKTVFPEANTGGGGGGASSFADLSGLPNSNTNLKKQVNPLNLVSLSQMGVPNDAALSDGSTTFGTDAAAAIQTVLDINAAGGPLHVYWDVKCSISQRLVIHPNTTILAAQGCGVILRNNSNDFMFVNKALEDVLALGPGAGQDAALATLTTTIADENIYIKNLIINGNSRNADYSTGVPSYGDVNDDGTYAQLKFNTNAGFMTGLIMVGVRNVTLDNVHLRCHRAYHAFFNNWENLTIKDGSCWSDETQVVNMDGYHFGPGSRLRMSNLYGRCGDAFVALNASDVNYQTQISTYAPGSPRFPITDGPIDDVIIDGIHLVDSRSGVALLSGQELISNVSVYRMTGTVTTVFFYADNLTYNPSLLAVPGPGYFKNIVLDGAEVDVTAEGELIPHVSTNTFFSGNYDGLKIRNMKRRFYYSARPSIMLYGDSAKTFKGVEIEGYEGINTSSYDCTHIVVKNTFQTDEQLSFRNCQVIRSTFGGDAFILQQDSGTRVAHYNIEGFHGFNIANVLKLTGGKAPFIRSIGITHINQNGASFYRDISGTDHYLSGYVGSWRTAGVGTYTHERGDGWDTILNEADEDTTFDTLNGWTVEGLSGGTAGIVNQSGTNRLALIAAGGQYAYAYKEIYYTPGDLIDVEIECVVSAGSPKFVKLNAAQNTILHSTTLVTGTNTFTVDTTGFTGSLWYLNGVSGGAASSVSVRSITAVKQ